MTAAIQTQGLTRRFGRHVAVDRISLHVPARSVYGFLGRNGAGKTTTIKLLLGLLRPDAGEISVCGIDVVRQRRLAARKVGALLEAHGFYPNLDGRENLRLCCRLLGLPAAEAERVLELTDMREHAARRVADYSLGMRQRLGLARAMLGAPPVLVLDEPSNGLDPEGIAEMRGFLRELPGRSGATVLLSSHLLGEIEQVATHVGIVSHGQLVLQGELAGLQAGMAAEVRVETDDPGRALQVAMAHGFKAERRGDDAIVARIAHGEALQRAAAGLNQALCAAGVAVHALLPGRQSLETVYHAAQSPGSVA